LIAKAKKFYQEHKEACMANNRDWKRKNKDKIREYNKKYKQKHAEKAF